MNYTPNISLSIFCIKSNFFDIIASISLSNFYNFPFKQRIFLFNNNLKFAQKTNGISKEPHTRPHLLPCERFVNQFFAKSYVVSGCRDWGTSEEKTTDSNNNNSSNDNNNRDCYYNNNDNNRYLKQTLCGCVFRRLKSIYTYTYKVFQHITFGLALITVSTITSCKNTHYIYRVEYNDGTVEYYTKEQYGSLEPTENIKETIRIKENEIGRYE